MSYLVFFDLDDTLIKGQSQKMLVKYLFKKNKVNLVFLVNIYLWFFLYKLNLVKDVIKIREKAFKICKGWKVDKTKQLLKDFFNIYIKLNFYLDALKQIDFHKSKGAKIILLSASLFPLVDIIKEFLEVDFIIATKLDEKDKIYTGKVFGSVVYGKNKEYLIKEFLEEHHFSLKDSYAYSDHYSDIEILKLVENPVIINPDDKLLKIALLNNWKVEYFKN